MDQKRAGKDHNRCADGNGGDEISVERCHFVKQLFFGVTAQKIGERCTDLPSQTHEKKLDERWEHC